MPALWGCYPPGENIKGGVRKFLEDDYLYGEIYKPGDILHIFGDWPIENEKVVKEEMDRRGWLWCDKKDFGVDFHLLRKSLKSIWAVFSPKRLAKSDAKMMYHGFLSYISHSNTDYQAELIRNDYNPAHLLHTQMMNSFGRKTIGVAHAANPKACPQLKYVHFDAYCTACEIYDRTWAKKSGPNLPEEQRIEKTGRETLDHAFDAKTKRWKVRNELKILWKHDPIRIILILLPGAGVSENFKPWAHMLAALEIINSIKGDHKIIIRFRDLEDKRMMVIYEEYFFELKELKKVWHKPTQFTTLELMAASDLVIAPNASWAINEALVMVKPVFTFSFLGYEEEYFPPEIYGKDFIIKTASQLVETVHKFLKDDMSFDVNWMRMTEDADYHLDGKNSQRLAQVMYEMEKSCK